MTEYTRTTIRLESDKWKQIRIIALHKGISANQIIQDAVDRYLEPVKVKKDK